MSDLLLLCRTILAATFILSAVWKLRNRAQFRVVLVAGPLRLGGVAQKAIGPAVASLELAIAAALLLFPTSWPLGLAAITFLVAFSIFLARSHSLANGCGCWRPARRGGGGVRPYLIRNGLLIAIAAFGSIPAHGIRIGDQIALAALSLLPAWLVMEIPALAEILTPLAPHDTRGTPGGLIGRTGETL
jgi:hypothetical protein